MAIGRRSGVPALSAGVAVLLLLPVLVEAGMQKGSLPPTAVRVPWVGTEGVRKGWDWSLPPYVQPTPYSGLAAFSKCRAPGNVIRMSSPKWSELEPEEGRYTFGKLKARLQNPPAGAKGWLLRLGGSDVGYAHAVPQWLLDKYDPPLVDMGAMVGKTGKEQFHVTAVAIWHPDVQSAYLKMVEELGKSGIPHLHQVYGAYIHGISKSRGEELFIPRDVVAGAEKDAGMTPELLEKAMRERIDGWVKAFRGVEYKLAFVGGGVSHPRYRGLGDRLVKHAIESGVGWRGGGIENFNTFTNSPLLGQSVDARGYLKVDESVPLISESRYFGEENEEYGPGWTWRFTELSAHPHRLRESMLRALQMRMNFMWIGQYSIWINPELMGYLSLELGKNVWTTPDAWCYLRESYYRKWGRGARGSAAPMKNYNRWISQRDGPGSKAKPASKTERSKLWPDPERHSFDYTARTTDRASGNDHIDFFVDERFLFRPWPALLLKVTYVDGPRAKWTVVYQARRKKRRTQILRCTGTGETRTATFVLKGIAPAGNAPEFSVVAVDGDIAVKFVRLIKLVPPVPPRGAKVPPLRIP